MDFFALDQSQIGEMQSEELAALVCEIEAEIERQSFLAKVLEKDLECKFLSPEDEQNIRAQLTYAINYRMLLTNKLTLLRDRLRNACAPREEEEESK